MVRVSECFRCGAKEDQVKLIYTTEGPVLCEECDRKSKQKQD